MQTATKKPVQIEFVLFNGSNHQEVIDFTNFAAALKSTVPFSEQAPDRDRGYVMSIKTLEGEMIASVGDYVIKGVKGEFYPCKSDVFLASYTIDQ